jgi:crossover junction endodeoxyribonuclease RuvC
MTLTIGIDCGLTGAVAAIDEHLQVILLADLPVATHFRTKWIHGPRLARLVREACAGQPATVHIEQTHAMPALGCVAAHSKGLTLGSTLAALQTLDLPTYLVASQSWKAQLGLLRPHASDREKKLVSLTRARELFPGAALERQKDHNRAEALLIAYAALARRQSREVA